MVSKSGWLYKNQGKHQMVLNFTVISTTISNRPVSLLHVLMKPMSEFDPSEHPPLHVWQGDHVSDLV